MLQTYCVASILRPNVVVVLMLALAGFALIQSFSVSRAGNTPTPNAINTQVTYIISIQGADETTLFIDGEKGVKFSGTKRFTLDGSIPHQFQVQQEICQGGWECESRVTDWRNGKRLVAKQYVWTVPAGTTETQTYTETYAQSYFVCTSYNSYGSCVSGYFACCIYSTQVITNQIFTPPCEPCQFTFQYTPQYRLVVEDKYGPTGYLTGWYDSCATVQLPSPSGYRALGHSDTVAGAPGIRYVFNGWQKDQSGSITSTFTMCGPHLATATYVTQYRLEVTSQCPAFNAKGSDWYPEGATATAQVESQVPMSDWLGRLGGKYEFSGWLGNPSITSPSAQVVMKQPQTYTATCNADYTTPAVILIPAITCVAAGGGYYIYKKKNRCAPLKKRVDDLESDAQKAKESYQDAAKKYNQALENFLKSVGDELEIFGTEMAIGAALAAAIEAGITAWGPIMILSSALEIGGEATALIVKNLQWLKKSLEALEVALEDSVHVSAVEDLLREHSEVTARHNEAEEARQNAVEIGKLLWAAKREYEDCISRPPENGGHVCDEDPCSHQPVIGESYGSGNFQIIDANGNNKLPNQPLSLGDHIQTGDDGSLKISLDQTLDQLAKNQGVQSPTEGGEPSGMVLEPNTSIHLIDPLSKEPVPWLRMPEFSQWWDRAMTIGLGAGKFLLNWQEAGEEMKATVLLPRTPAEDDYSWAARVNGTRLLVEATGDGSAAAITVLEDYRKQSTVEVWKLNDPREKILVHGGERLVIRAGKSLPPFKFNLDPNFRLDPFGVLQRWGRLPPTSAESLAALSAPTFHGTEPPVLYKPEGTKQTPQSSTNFCGNCGSPVDRDVKFCGNCGNPTL